MWRQQDFCPGQSRDASIFDKVIVVANQHSDTAAVGRVEDCISIAGRKELAHEYMQFAMASPAAVGHGDDVAIVELVVGVSFDKPRADRDAVSFRKLHQSL